MKKHVAIVATTHKLANGFQHRKADLEALAEGFRERIGVDPFLNENHLEGPAPIGRIVEAWVDAYQKDGTRSPDQFALYLRFEVLSGADPERVASLLENGGFSVAFFSTRLGRGPGVHADLSLTIGLSAELLPDLQAAKPVLDALRDDLPDVNIEIGRYHEHELVSTTTLILVVGWVGGKIAEKLFDKLWTALENPAISAWRKLVARIKLGVDTRNGRILATIPADGEANQLRRALSSIVEETYRLEGGNVRRRISILITEEWEIRRHEEEL